ncbi:MAG: glycoside hydrolase family 9 protein [Treponema sp.]|nr:glycoside hydrolase family 9 protein [Treponema sp.]
MERNNESLILVNQIGYIPGEAKFAYIQADSVEAAGKTFSLVEKNSGKCLFSGDWKKSVEDAAAGDSYCYADFSDFTGQSGTEYVIISNAVTGAAPVTSFPFKISDNIYDDLYFSTLNYFKLSRCGQGICHTGKAVVYGSDEEKDVQGGWHDAGDYGRYVVAGAKTVMDLLLAYDFSAARFNRFDILDEVRFELEWMLQMQREDGAVYHKISCYHFCAFINPEDEKDQLVLSPVSTAATADFVGTLSYAAGYFMDLDGAFAERLLAAALKAQSYLDTHEDELYINPPEITTGGYGDRDVSDERYFALCALFVRTGKSEYLAKALKIRHEKEAEPRIEGEPWRGWFEHYGWGCVSGYGTEILLKNLELVKKSACELGQSGDLLAEELKKYFLLQAEKSLEFSRASVFGLDIPHFGWGSNGSVCDVAHIMMVAYRLCGKEEYKTVARRQISYILGCNPLNFCYITGSGSKSPVNPHHRPSGASKKVMPGMLAGGPCEGLNDAYAKSHLNNLPPLKCYADAEPSYSTNEVAIYWNSAFVYLLAALYF